MASYLELVGKDVCFHKSCDTSSYPSFVSEFVQSLKNELKIPGWLKSGPVPYTNERVINLVHQLRASDVADSGIWDGTDMAFDKETEQRLHAVFNTALSDCARIQAVVKAEYLTGTPYPKESFLIILVRNAILGGHTQLSTLEDISVVLPRHFGGEAIPVLDYMTKSLCAPLVISICQEVPIIKESSSDMEDQSSDEEDSSIRSTLFKNSPSTLSEWLDASETTSEEVEEEQAEIVPSPQFDAYFIAYRPPMAPPSVCHIPILCMANEEQLPVLMASFLYQRRMWRLSDPLIGLGFSKYDTAIRLFVGWLEDDPSSDRTLPLVHFGEIGTPVKLDLSCPSVVLVVSRLLCSLESYISAMRDSVRHSVGAVIGEARSYSTLSWRIDTSNRKEDSILGNNNTREMIIQWVKSQKYLKYEETMPRDKEANKITSHGRGSVTSAPSPHQSSSTQSFHSAPSVPSKEGSIPELREPPVHDDSIPTFRSHLSCSEFAVTSEQNDYRMFRWMFDRRVIPQCLPSDSKFREEYVTMTSFIWPDTWRIREDLPPVDVALEPCVQELLEGVARLRKRPGVVQFIPIERFPVNLRILEQSFSAIFQTSRRSREKGKLQEQLYEAAWRHDHDRLLFDFFIRLVQPRKDNVAYILTDNRSIADLEDPLTRPTLETTLRFPKSDNLQRGVRRQLQRSLRGPLVYRPTDFDLDSWVQSRGDPADAIIQEDGNYAYILSQFSSWARVTNIETEEQMVSELGYFPSKGRCDALGRLLVELPILSTKDTDRLMLVDQPTLKHDSTGGTKKAKVSVASTEATSRTSKRKTSQKSLTVPDTSSGVMGMNGTRYSIPSSSVSTSMEYLDEEGGGSGSDLQDTIDALAHKAQRLRLRPDTTWIELPILAAKYKKASDSLVKGTNQLRMYLTASVKFLQAIKITNFPVYGVQTDGPVVVLPAAVLRDDNFVYLYERLVERLDISTPLGAWHYATILCRLATNHAKVLEDKFEEVRKDLIASSLSKGNQDEGWTMDDQITRLIAENKARPAPKKNTKR